MILNKHIIIETPGLRVRWIGESDELGLLNGKVYDVEAIEVYYNAEEKHGNPKFCIRDEGDMASEDTASIYGPDEEFEIAEGADIYAAAEKEAEERLGFKVPFPKVGGGRI